MAGLGDYAFNGLGWRDAVVVGDDYFFSYTEAAGFVAEFCALGGNIIDRVWTPFGTEDYTPYVPRLRADEIDGFFVSFNSFAGAGMPPFLEAVPSLRPDLDTRIVGGSLAVSSNELSALGDDIVGVVSAKPWFPGQNDPAWLAYVEELDAAFPSSRRCFQTSRSLGCRITQPWKRYYKRSKRSMSTCPATSESCRQPLLSSSSTGRLAQSCSRAIAKRSQRATSFV